MILIPLSRGYNAQVDDHWAPFLNRWKWTALVLDGGLRYAVRFEGRGQNRRCIYMHCVILPNVPRVDHRDGDGLNNQEGNLRTATHSQNLANRGPQKNNSSGYKGVSWSKCAQKWEARIKVRGRQQFLGLFSTPKQAAEVYDAAAKEAFGEFAFQNI